MKSNRYTLRGMSVALALVGAILLSGCGNLQAPLAPGLGGPVSPVKQVSKNVYDGSQYIIAFSTKALDPSGRAFKPTLFSKVSGPFTALAGGSLAITMPTDSTTGVRLKSAVFAAVGGSLLQDRQITMTGAYGATLTDIGVIFGPTGTSFNPMASLVMVVKGPVTDAQIAAMTAFHIHSGSAEAIQFQAVRTNTDEVTITVGVPGFSSYSLGDDNFPPEPGP